MKTIRIFVLKIMMFVQGIASKETRVKDKVGPDPGALGYSPDFPFNDDSE